MTIDKTFDDLVSVYVSKLTVVEEKIKMVLKRGELSKSNYFNQLERILKEGKFCQGLDFTTASEVADEVGNRMLQSGSVYEVDGIKSSYVKATKNAFLVHTRSLQDAGNYKDAFFSTKAYLEKIITKKKISVGRFESLANDYIWKKPEFSEGQLDFELKMNATERLVAELKRQLGYERKEGANPNLALQVAVEKKFPHRSGATNGKSVDDLL